MQCGLGLGFEAGARVGEPGLGHFPATVGTFYWEPEPQRELLYLPGAGTV